MASAQRNGHVERVRGVTLTTADSFLMAIKLCVGCSGKSDHKPGAGESKFSTETGREGEEGGNAAMLQDEQKLSPSL